MARKAVKKAVKRAAPKKQYVVGWTAESGNEPDFLTGIYDTVDMAKRAAELSFNFEDEQFFIYEVKLVAQSEDPVPQKLNWKSK